MGLFSKTTAPSPDARASGDGALAEASVSELMSIKNGKGSKSKPPPNPFVEQGRTELYGFYYDQAKGRRNWQLIAFVLLGLNVLLVVATIGLATDVRYVPYLVEQAELGGVRYIGPIEELTDVEGMAKPAVLGQWVKDVRTIYEDPAARKDMLYKAYAHTAGDALDGLGAYYSKPDTDPGRLAKNGISRTVEIESVVGVPNPSGTGATAGETFKVAWRERTRIGSTGQIETKRHEGYFTLIVMPPATDKVAMQNPVGVYISDFSWGEVSGRP